MVSESVMMMGGLGLIFSASLFSKMFVSSLSSRCGKVGGV